MQGEANASFHTGATRGREGHSSLPPVVESVGENEQLAEDGHGRQTKQALQRQQKGGERGEGGRGGRGGGDGGSKAAPQVSVLTED